MNTVYEKVNGEYIPTRFGSQLRDSAISQMIVLASQCQEAYIKENMRAYIESGIWEGKLVVRVVNKGNVLKQYGV